MTKTLLQGKPKTSTDFLFEESAHILMLRQR